MPCKERPGISAVHARESFFGVTLYVDDLTSGPPFSNVLDTHTVSLIPAIRTEKTLPTRYHPYTWIPRLPQAFPAFRSLAIEKELRKILAFITFDRESDARELKRADVVKLNGSDFNAIVVS
ncbi:dna repair protein rad16 [Moniliophthora roreri]|nr:dna repair protein rad16 [Moniliophthora roreri]